MLNKRQTGTQYEQLAVLFLEGEGYRILERNFRCRQGEIDIIALDREYLVFLEVKYRKDDRMGTGAEAVGPAKQQKIVRCARYYLMKHPKYEREPCRFDVVSVCGEKVTLYRDAFQAAMSM